MEHLGQRDADGRVVGIGLHDVGHVGPPLLADLRGAEVLAAAVAFKLLVGVERVGVFVEVNAVVAHAAFAQQTTQFGEQVGMTTLVLLFLSWVQEHLKCFSSHGNVCLRVCDWCKDTRYLHLFQISCSKNGLNLI